jgi:YD repeat-containing protein
MKNLFSIVLLGLLAASPAFGQSSLLVARTTTYVDEAGIPYNGDSTTLAYNSQLLINQSKSWKMDSVGNLNLRFRTTNYSYDANGNLLYYAYQVGDDVNGWTDIFRYTYTFDTDGNELSYLAEVWNGSAWITQSDSRVRVFDANGNLISSTGTTQRTFLTYDAEDLLQTETLQFLVNGNWVNHSRKVYTYLPNFTTLRITANWMGTGWSDTYRSTINYNASGKVVQHSSESWNGTIWTNDSRLLNSYNANGDLLEETIQFWKGTEWENFHLISNSYDAANNHIYWISSDWIDSTWVGYVRQFLSYDIENRFINSRTESSASGDWRLEAISKLSEQDNNACKL